MKQPPKTIVRDDRGQSLVEFALTLPMLLVCMFMITEFGRALYQYNVLVQATREAARVAVVSAAGQASNDGNARMDEFLDRTGMELNSLVRDCVVINDFEGTGTKVVRATAEMPFRWILQGDLPTNADGSAPVAPTGLTLSAETVMRAETF